MEFATRSLSAQESRIVLALSESGRREITRAEISDLLGHIEGGRPCHLIVTPQGMVGTSDLGRLPFPEYGPDALGNSNLLALASRITKRYHIGFGTAAAHYGLTTQHRNVIFVVTPRRLRERTVGGSRVQIVTQAESKFFGFAEVDVLGYKVMLSDREKTAIDCIDHPEFTGGVGEAAAIFATASRRRFDWDKASDYLDRIGAGALARRFGWLADFIKADMPSSARARIVHLAARSRKTWLGAPPEHLVPRAIGYDATWKIFVNVAPEELHDIAGLGMRKAAGRED
jgi:predicted transcriptional regulator of viral defense system